MATTDLKLEQCGTLAKPGPVGRLVRLGFGVLCLNYVSVLWLMRSDLMADPITLQPALWNGIVFGLLLVSYVINIGFSQSWKKWPALVSAMLLLLVAAIGYLQTGYLETPLLAGTIFLWAFYIFAHLGFAFILSGIFATPGCEMRALHHLYTRVSGVPTKEHRCPIGPLQPIDSWEEKQPWYK